MAETESVIQQAGAITFKPGTPPLVLLVRAKKDSVHWIFPKGHIDIGETAEGAAVRELLEEAGITGRPVGQAGECEHRIGEKRYHVKYFLVAYGSTESSGEPGRTPCWCTIDEALALLTFPDSRKILNSIVPCVKQQR
jgi:8-oxo-dGTP pyrophosphatase MutT (NUDIX family)